METDKDKLTNGNFFIKHHRYSKPKIRHIWCSEDLTQIFWGSPKDLGKVGRKAAGSILAAEVVRICNG